MVPGLILTGVTCHSPSVRVVAIKCLGLICLFSKFKAQEHWDLFFQVNIGSERRTDGPTDARTKLHPASDWTSFSLKPLSRASNL